MVDLLVRFITSYFGLELATSSRPSTAFKLNKSYQQASYFSKLLSMVQITANMRSDFELTKSFTMTTAAAKASSFVLPCLHCLTKSLITAQLSVAYRFRGSTVTAV